MIPKIVHLIWFGPLHPRVEESVAMHRQLNPGYDVRLHTTTDEVRSGYRRHLDNVARLPALRADLLRWSLLEKHGGWYFDIDVELEEPLERIEHDLGLDGRLLFLTKRGRLPNNDIMAVAPGWPHWGRVHEYLDNYRPAKRKEGGMAVFYSCFSLDVILRAVIGRDGRDVERWTCAPDWAFNPKSPSRYGYRKPFRV